MKKLKKIIIITVTCILCIGIIGTLAAVGINLYVTGTAKNNIITTEDAAELSEVDCIMVLGCQVKPGGNPSAMLRDRLDRAIELYKAGAAPKLLMSGDHGTVEYDEVHAMKNYAIQAGVPSEDIFMDHAGFSTYESVYRANEIFDADNIIIVTQEYHLYRALYIADKFGLESHGVTSDYHTYAGQSIRDAREVLARVKDFVTCIFKPEPTFLGESIPVSGNGDVTN